MSDSRNNKDESSEPCHHANSIRTANGAMGAKAYYIDEYKTSSVNSQSRSWYNHTHESKAPYLGWHDDRIDSWRLHSCALGRRRALLLFDHLQHSWWSGRHYHRIQIIPFTIMITFISQIIHRYRTHGREPSFLLALSSSIALLAASLVINYHAALYAQERVSGSVTDIFLSNFPVVSVDVFFVYGPIIFWMIILGFCLHDPRKIPFIIKCISLFIITRSLFITLTHIGPFPDHIQLQHSGSVVFDAIYSVSNFFFLSTGNDLFFSGHTGLPYLMCLVFWEHKPMRIFCLLSAIFFGIIVLLGHFHYTIDVLSAFFITYSIFHIGEVLFPKDKRMFIESHGKIAQK